MQWNMLVDFKLLRKVQPNSQVIKLDVRYKCTTDLYDTLCHTDKLPLDCIIITYWTRSVFEQNEAAKLSAVASTQTGVRSGRKAHTNYSTSQTRNHSESCP